MTPALAQHLRDLGLIERPEVKQPREVRDVSWFKRGEECPH